MKLEVENLNVNYGDKEIIKDFSFNINAGEMVTVIGPNGGGECTLIKTSSR